MAGTDPRGWGSTVLIGAATGLRSSSGVAALCLAGPTERLSPFFRRTEVRAASGLLAVGELVGDQLPSTPDRTGAPGLVPRIALGAVTAQQLARGTKSPAAVAALLGAAAALGAAFGGLAVRRRLAEELGPIPAAVIEDAVCAALAGAALWLSRGAVDPPIEDPDQP